MYVMNYIIDHISHPPRDLLCCVFSSLFFSVLLLLLFCVVRVAMCSRCCGCGVYYCVRFLLCLPARRPKVLEVLVGDGTRVRLGILAVAHPHGLLRLLELDWLTSSPFWFRFIKN